MIKIISATLLIVILTVGLVGAADYPALVCTIEPKTVYVKVFTQCLDKKGSPIVFEYNRAITTNGDIGNIFFPTKGDCRISMLASTTEATVIHFDFGKEQR